MASSKEMRVGAFVLAGLVVMGVVIFLIGDEKRAFDAKATYRSTFTNVQGLKTGAPVRLGGIDIGQVGSIAHSSDPADSHLYVEMHIVKSEAARIRQDTKAQVANRGLLGDKMIELTGGSPQSPPVPPGGEIQGIESGGLEDLFGRVGDMAGRADSIMSHLEVATRTLADEQLQRDIHDGVHSLSVLLRQASDGNGYVHRLLTDPKEADRVSALVSHLEEATGELETTLRETRGLVDQAKRGPGFAHDLLYGEQGTEAMTKLGGAAGEVAVTLRSIREGNGLAHGLLFGGENSQAASADLNGTLTDLRAIVADVRAGKGTIGALLVDPSIYEDLKGILGNVERNDVLRALVRYSIKQDEKKRDVRTPASDQAAVPAPPR